MRRHRSGARAGSSSPTTWFGTAAVAAAAAVALAGCTSDAAKPAAATPATSALTSTTSTTTSTTTTTSSSSSASATPAGRSIAITVTGRTVNPPPAQVDLPVGQTLTLVVTSDHDDQLHAHGFEVEVDITAGSPATIALTGSTPGVYQVELHEPALTLLTVAVR